MEMVEQSGGPASDPNENAEAGSTVPATPDGQAEPAPVADPDEEPEVVLHSIAGEHDGLGLGGDEGQVPWCIGAVSPA